MPASFPHRRRRLPGIRSGAYRDRTDDLQLANHFPVVCASSGSRAEVAPEQGFLGALPTVLVMRAGTPGSARLLWCWCGVGWLLVLQTSNPRGTSPVHMRLGPAWFPGWGRRAERREAHARAGDLLRATGRCGALTTTTPDGASRLASGMAAGASALGLVGVVEDGGLGTLLRGVDPGSGDVLRAPVRERTITVRTLDVESGEWRDEEKRLAPVSGYDLVFSCPKSVSLLHALTDSERVREPDQRRARDRVAVRSRLPSSRAARRASSAGVTAAWHGSTARDSLRPLSATGRAERRTRISIPT